MKVRNQIQALKDYLGKTPTALPPPSFSHEDSAPFILFSENCGATISCLK